MAGCDQLLHAIRAQSVQRVLEVLEREPGAACRASFEYDGFPPLCAAVEHGCLPEIVQVLLEHGADVQAQSQRRETALGLLCSWASYSPEPFAAPGHFPWDRELEAMRCRHMAVATMLVEAGADPTEKHNSGQSCFEWAAAACREPFSLGDQEAPQIPADDAFWDFLFAGFHAHVTTQSETQSLPPRGASSS